MPPALIVRCAITCYTQKNLKLTHLLLAAGRSRRMGGPNKLLLPFRGSTLLEATLDNLLLTGMGEVVVVLGHEAGRIRSLLRGRDVRFVENPDHGQGMTTSIQAGVRAAGEATDGYAICLADMPLVAPAEYQLLASAFFTKMEKDGQAIVQPVFQGQRGHPVIFSRHYHEAILRLAYPEGCKPIVQENRDHLALVEMPTDGILLDADDAAAYQALLARG